KPPAYLQLKLAGFSPSPARLTGQPHDANWHSVSAGLRFFAFNSLERVAGGSIQPRMVGASTILSLRMTPPLYRCDPQDLHLVVCLLSSPENACERFCLAFLLGNCEQRNPHLSRYPNRRPWLAIMRPSFISCIQSQASAIAGLCVTRSSAICFC